MPRLSLDARRVLSGVGGGRVYVDGVVPAGLESMLGGDWAWFEQDGVSSIVGNGSRDGGASWHLWSYRLSDGVVAELDPRGATATYGGAGTWAAYLASRPIVSYDNHGATWTATRVARGVSPDGVAIYTSPENDVLYWGAQAQYGVRIQTIQIGVEDAILWWDDQAKAFRTIGAPVPVWPVSGGVGARFTSRWLCQWNAGLKALVVYPWQTTGRLEGYALSRDEHDFNHDIGWRPDGMLIVATGVNQGETAIRVYELDLAQQRFRVNGGAWLMLEPVSMDVPYVPPIDPPDPVDPVDPDGPIDPPDPVDPVNPVDPEDGDVVKIGQKGYFRPWGTTTDSAHSTKATAQGHQDAGYMSVQLEDGKFVTFDPATALPIGSAPVAGAWERVTFNGGNILVAQPNGGQGGVALPYEWISL